jgi:uncharacterized membrane protein HdeD (DUF308 family)
MPAGRIDRPSVHDPHGPPINSSERYRFLNATSKHRLLDGLSPSIVGRIQHMSNDGQLPCPNQFGIRTLLAATGGCACFFALGSFLVTVPDPVTVYVVPCFAGAFWGIAVAQRKKHSTVWSVLTGGLLGGGGGLVPAALFVSILALDGQKDRAFMLLNSVILCLCVSGIVAGMFGLAHGGLPRGRQQMSPKELTEFARRRMKAS